MEIEFQHLLLMNLELMARQKDDYGKFLLSGIEKVKYTNIQIKNSGV